MSRKSKKSDGEMKLFHFKKEKLALKCGWSECSVESQVSFDSLDLFLHHVENHAADATSDMPSSDGVVSKACRWTECSFTSESATDLQLHINFHAFHTKLKNLGDNMSKRKGLGKCKQSESSRYLVPDLPENLCCCWYECERVLYNPEVFYHHVSQHVTCSSDQDVRCQWEGCGAHFGNRYKLRDHLRSHTQEKVIACPNCGTMFYNRTKFVDHIKRQTADLEYECSHCSRIMASERLLRDHMRHHINHLKCPKCDMTCTNPSSLANHLKYRHTVDRPFPCTFCEYSAKSQNDLCKHLPVHLVEPQFKCTHAGCDYICRHERTLNRHVLTAHKGEGKKASRYKCHVCEHTFCRGAFLTRHLIKAHRFRWPSGHSRFRYKRGKDGFFQLETVRYELIERQEDDAEDDVDDPEDMLGVDDGIEEDEDTDRAELGGEQPVTELSIADETFSERGPTEGQKSILASITGPDGQPQELVQILVDDRAYAMFEENAAECILPHDGS